MDARRSTLNSTLPRSADPLQHVGDGSRPKYQRGSRSLLTASRNRGESVFGSAEFREAACAFTGDECSQGFVNDGSTLLEARKALGLGDEDVVEIDGCTHFTVRVEYVWNIHQLMLYVMPSFKYRATSQYSPQPPSRVHTSAMRCAWTQLTNAFRSAFASCGHDERQRFASAFVSLISNQLVGDPSKPFCAGVPDLTRQ